MGSTKHILASKTVWGGILMALAWMLQQFFGVHVSSAETGQAAEALSQGIGAGEWGSIISAAIGFVMVVWGRFTAKKQVTVIPGG